MMPIKLAVIIVFLATRPALAQTAVYVVRHAEKAAVNGDPPLTAEGQKRADCLAKLLKDANIKAIYTSDALRTQQTATPLAMANNLQPVVVPGGDPDLTVTKIRADHPHESVLIVGHSNTVPLVVKSWVPDAQVTVADDEFDKIFVIIPDHSKGGWVRFRFNASN